MRRYVSLSPPKPLSDLSRSLTSLKLFSTMFHITLLFIILISVFRLVTGSSSISSTIPMKELVLSPNTRSRNFSCRTSNDCTSNKICVNTLTKKYCSSEGSPCLCVAECDAPEDCNGSKCAKGGEGKDFPPVCFTCGSTNITNEIPGHDCPTENCYDTGCDPGSVCVERDFGRFTMCKKSNKSCSCGLACDGSGICIDYGAKCGVSDIGGVDTLRLCFTCESENITVLEGQACGSPKPSVTSMPPSSVGEKTDNDIPIALVVGISLIAVSLIIAVVLLLICRRSNNANESNGEGTVKNLFIFQKIHFFSKK